MALTYQCPLYEVSAGVYKLLTDKDMQEYENLQLSKRRWIKGMK